ncbi:hypothetical protein SteCoe_35598 [Stentor coeruleus]|uniref:Uncharacterized protein n=1 Tax=Stentor coeruleus TaxID=5963 RepID=A0A1R2AS23_9CILI|nr:hypothetical protein SteCoe_35598 [Stentor coeruleus]
MEEIARGVGVHGKDSSETTRSSITDIDFRFIKKQCTISITLNNQQTEKFKINYEETNFSNALEKPLKSLGLGLLDYTSVNNLYQIKLVDNLLVKALKKGMQLINKFSAQGIHNISKNESIQELVKIANGQAMKILADIEEKFSKMTGIIEDVQMEVYDRSSLIKKAKEEIVDNLNRKHVLVVNQLIELSRGHKIPESNLSEQVKELINNL